MHHAAHEFVRAALLPSVLEFGSYDVNGTVRDLFPHHRYVGVDRVAGPGVDVVADAAAFDAGERFDFVVCCEVFEHAEDWRAIVANAAKHLKPAGVFVGTAAGVGRPPHLCSGHPMPDPPTEWYANVEKADLRRELRKYFDLVRIDVLGDDIRWVASGNS